MCDVRANNNKYLVFAGDGHSLTIASHNGSELENDALKLYRGSGLEPIAREVLSLVVKICSCGSVYFLLFVSNISM